MRTHKPPELPRVVVGQIWRDNDTQRIVEKCERYLKVVELVRPQYSPYPEETFVKCRVGYLDKDGAWQPDGEKRTRIMIGRMRPTANGYVLVQDV